LAVSLRTLPEFQSLPRVWFCAESQIKNSRQRRLCREFFIWFSAQKKHLANRLLYREANKKLLAQKKTLAKDFFTQRQLADSRQRISFPSALFFALDKEIFKNPFFTSNFFLSSTYTYKKLMLKVGTISAMFAIFKNFTS
jgi:hypothetical protein